MQRSTLIALTAGAFLVGAVIGGLAVGSDDTPSSAARAPPRPTGTSGGVVISVENIGTRAINASLTVTTAQGAPVWTQQLTVPAGATREHDLGRLRGDHFASGRFTWAEPPRRGTGDFIMDFDGGECGSQRLHVVFRVDSTNGISFPDGDVKRCR